VQKLLLLASAAVAALVVAGSVSAANPRSVTVMTQNVYQGTELEHVLAATSFFGLAVGVATDYANVAQTNFAERADAMAAEIAGEGPALVGLQEVATWRTRFPTNPFAPPVPATTVSYDFLQMLLDALAAHGASYEAVVVETNWEAQAPGFFPFGFMDVRLTEQGAILARTDLPTSELVLSNPQSGNYVAATTIPFLTGPFRIGGGWSSVDAKVRGKTFRFITTHLDPIQPSVRTAQAHELLAGPAATSLPVVLTGDLNSDPSSQAYADLVGAGFVDTWLAANPGDPGLTCCQVPPDTIVNPVSQLHERVDHVLARGGFAVFGDELVGDQPSDRTASGLWPSDHAGLVATLGIEPLSQNG
jgi:hypothetical protein